MRTFVTGLPRDDSIEVQDFMWLFMVLEPGLVPRQEFWVLRWGLD